MITIETGNTNNLPYPINEIKSVAYDGSEYALLQDHQKNITRLSNELRAIEIKETRLHYACICYDSQECCYYACAYDHPSYLYRLDLDFTLVGRLCVGEGLHHVAIALSMHPTKPLLYMLYHKEIVCWNMATLEFQDVVHLEEECHVLDIVVLCDGFILAYQKGSKVYLEIRCDQCDEPKLYHLPNDYEFHSMVLLDYCVNENGCSNYKIQLFLRNCISQQQITLTLEIICGNQHSPSCDITCKGSKNEVIHSIALEEAAIAHILNAEGEKIQKAVASDISLNDLLAVNESVRKTITQITLLEGQLYSKLESLHCLCDEDSHDE